MVTPSGRSTTISPFSRYCTCTRLGQEGGYRRGDELLALAAADDQRALLARADEHVGLVEAHRDERIVALELGVGGAYRVGKVAGVVVGDQMRDDLGVGLRGEHGALASSRSLSVE